MSSLAQLFCQYPQWFKYAQAEQDRLVEEYGTVINGKVRDRLPCLQALRRVLPGCTRPRASAPS